MRQRQFRLASQLAFVLVVVLLARQQGFAQSGGSGNPLRQQNDQVEPLTTKQRRLAERFDQLELLAGRLAELSRSTQPRRARLLRELVAKSRERDIAGRFSGIVAALGRDNLGQASTDQVALQVDLQKLLDLLLQEDRDRQIESERKRIRKYLAEVKRLIQLQRGIKARTDGGDEADQLAQDQQRLAEATGKLQQEIRATEGAPARDPDAQSPRSDANGSKGQKQTGKSERNVEEEGGGASGDESKGDPQDGAPAERSAGKSAKPPSDKSASDQGDEGGAPDRTDSPAHPGDNQSQDEGTPTSKPAETSPEGAPKSGAEPSPNSPPQGNGSSPPSPLGNGEPSEQKSSPTERTEQRLKRAQQRMQDALDRLEEAKKEKAVAEQEQALRELEQAKAELERILRQLREEELERMLVLLEARFRKMLDAQVVVYDETKKLQVNQSSVPEHEIEIASGRLDRQERQIVREADRALVLLREDGTTVAFPEAIQQARDDMQTVANRLSEVKIGLITQGLEEDIIAVLEETLAALQQALKESRENRSEPQQGSTGEPGEQSLVDQLAELRMIRALQNRVNTRTQRYGTILGDQVATDSDLLEALDELALRQERIFQATRDLDSGRNK